MKTISLLSLTLGLILVAQAAMDITVTSGTFTGAKAFTGRAALVESNGQRYIQFDWKKKPTAAIQFRLVKQESLKVGMFPASAPFIDLGSAPTKVEISKDIDAWLYRSVAAVDPKTNQIIGFANLRSSQEKGR